MHLYLILLFLSAFSLNGCVIFDRSPKPPDTPLEYFNAERYSLSGVSVGVAGVAYVDRINPETHIAGTALIVATGVFYQKPAAFVHLQLYSTDAAELLLQEISTDENGHFRFARELANGLYRIECADARYQGHRLVHVDGYEVQGVPLELLRN